MNVGAKNLAIAWAWAEANQLHPLSRAYYEVCITADIGFKHEREIREEFVKTGMTEKKARFRARICYTSIKALRGATIDQRDKVCRIVLEYIRLTQDEGP